MFDNMNMIKAYKITDNITGGDVEVATFNAVLNKDSNINVYMNINYPNLYGKYKEEILDAYREFNAEVTTLAISMGLANTTNGISTLSALSDLSGDIKNMTMDIMNQVIESLGNIRVNPVPTMEVGHTQRF